MCASQTCREAAGRQPRALGQRAWPFRQAGRVRAHARYRPACCILHRSFSRLPKDAFSAIFLKGLKGLQCHARERQLPHKAYKSMRATSPSCKRNCSITSGSHGQAQLQVGTQAGGHLICSEPRPFGQPLTPKAEQAGPLYVAVTGYVRGPAHFAELAQGFPGRCLVANPVEDALRHGCPLWVSLGTAGAAVVLGQSFGALVARSLAARWEAMGREVRGIVLFDSRNIPRYLWRGDVCQSAVRNLQAAHFRLLQEFHFQAPFAPPAHSAWVLQRASSLTAPDAAQNPHWKRLGPAG